MNRVVRMTAATLSLLNAATADALINPNFTPNDLIAKADTVLVLKLGDFDKSGKCHAEVSEILKKPDGMTVGKVLSFEARSSKAEETSFIKSRLMARIDGPVLLCSGTDEVGKRLCVMHASGKWFVLEPVNATPDTWNILSVDTHLESTWAGGTDPLLSVIRIILAHPEVSVPVKAGVRWAPEVGLGKLEGKIHRLMAVDITGRGGNDLFVAAERGDRLYSWNKKAGRFEERSASFKLASSSKVACWGYFNGDDRLDLASWDGKTLTVWLQSQEGMFSPVRIDSVPDGSCLSLRAIDSGNSGRSGLLWASGNGVVVMTPEGNGDFAFSRKDLAVEAGVMKAIGKGGKALVADFDGDDVADVLQYGAKAGIFYKGKKAGEFESGTSCEVCAGTGETDAFIGDWNADGRLDVIAVSEDPLYSWENAGAGHFRDVHDLTGDLAYIAKPGGICGNTCDINNDGRQDIFIAHASNPAQVFFNRFFGSFGHAHELDLMENSIIEAAQTGLQAGIVADLNGDGAQDMAIILLSGEIYVLPRSSEEGPSLAAQVLFAPKSPLSAGVSSQP